MFLSSWDLLNFRLGSDSLGTHEDFARSLDEALARLIDTMSRLQELFGQIDIYLFDQLLRGNIVPGMRIFDAGCGSGRNLVYLLREGYHVYGVDADPNAIDFTRRIAKPLLPESFRVERIEA